MSRRRVNLVLVMDGERRRHDIVMALNSGSHRAANQLARVFAIDATCDLIGLESEVVAEHFSEAEIFGELYKYRSGVTVQTEGLVFSVFPEVKIRCMDTGVIRNGPPQSDRSGDDGNGYVSDRPQGAVG